MLKRNRTMGLVLSFDERKRFASLFVLLVGVHRRVQANGKKGKKNRKAKYKHQEIGPRIRGPLFVEKFVCFYCFNLNKLFKIVIDDKIKKRIYMFEIMLFILTYFLIPILSYFVSNYFILQRYFPKQHKTGWLTISSVFGSILIFSYLVYPFYFIETIHDLPVERGILGSMLENLIILLGIPFYVVLAKLNMFTNNLGPAGMIIMYTPGLFTLFALLQLLIQFIFSRKIFGKSSGQAFVPLVITSIISWFISILVTALAHISLQFFIRNVTI